MEATEKSNETSYPRLGCSKQHFPYVGVKSILALSQLDVPEGDNAKV
jgi:hypothetical protein